MVEQTVYTADTHRIYTINITCLRSDCVIFNLFYTVFMANYFEKKRIKVDNFHTNRTEKGLLFDPEWFG